MFSKAWASLIEKDMEVSDRGSIQGAIPVFSWKG
jgi:hypothetical protein